MQLNARQRRYKLQTRRAGSTETRCRCPGAVGLQHSRRGADVRTVRWLIRRTSPWHCWCYASHCWPTGSSSRRPNLIRLLKAPPAPKRDLSNPPAIEDRHPCSDFRTTGSGIRPPTLSPKSCAICAVALACSEFRKRFLSHGCLFATSVSGTGKHSAVSTQQSGDACAVSLPLPRGQKPRFG